MVLYQMSSSGLHRLNPKPLLFCCVSLSSLFKSWYLSFCRCSLIGSLLIRRVQLSLERPQRPSVYGATWQRSRLLIFHTCSILNISAPIISQHVHSPLCTGDLWLKDSFLCSDRWIFTEITTFCIRSPFIMGRACNNTQVSMPWT